MVVFNKLIFFTLLLRGEASRFRTNQRVLSEELIAGYEPKSTVTDHNAIDLDQKAMETELGEKTSASFSNARLIYEEGGYSKSYAVLTITGGVPVLVSKGDEISGVASNGDPVSGAALEDTKSGEPTINVQYKVSDKQATYVTCQVGGLPEPNLSGCFASSGIVVINGNQANYTYDPNTSNDNARTLQYFSDTADTRMRVNGEGAYYEDFQKFFDYYGQYDYADAFISAAFDKSSVNLGQVTFDFSGYSFDGQAEAIKKGSAYIATAMYAIRELEDALDDCARECETDCNDDPVDALDEAVAFYTGSLEGSDGAGDGVLMYSLADKRCKNFKTCGPDGDAITGTSKVNIDIFKVFDHMQQHLISKQCDMARGYKENVVKKMWVPLIQGTLRYAYIRSTEPPEEKAEAEGATFAAAILPVVAKCNPDDAGIIYNNMHPGSGATVDFASVKKAFEKNYKCLGITCADVGGLYNDADAIYFDGAGPCGSSSSSSSGNGANVGLAVGLSIGAVVAMALAVLFVRRRNSAKSAAVDFKMSEPGANQI